MSQVHQKTFFDKLKTRDIARVLRHTQTRAMGRLHIEDEENRVHGPGADAKKSLPDISPFWKFVEALENMPDNEDRQESEDE